MVASIMDLLRPPGRERERAAALLSGQALNPLTLEGYTRPEGLPGLWDFVQSPLESGTPLGNIWSQVGGRAPLNEGLFPWMTGIGAEDVPGMLPAGRAVGQAFGNVYGPESFFRRSALMQDTGTPRVTQPGSPYGRLAGNTGFAGALLERPRKGWIGGPVEGVKEAGRWVGGKAEDAWNAIGRALYGEDWGYAPPPMGEGPFAGPGIEMTEEAKRRYMEYNAPAEPGEAKAGAGTAFDLGGLPAYIEPPKYAGASAPDFSAALEALGAGPEKPGQRPLEERLGRVLGGGAAAGAAMMRGTTGGHSIAAALAGAAGGSGAALAEISREEQVRKDRWTQMMESHKARMSELHANASMAKSAHEQREAMAKLQSEQYEHQQRQSYEMLKQPKVHSFGGGLVGIQRYNEATGKSEVSTVDLLESWRGMDFMAKMAKANKQGKVWIGGDVEVQGMDRRYAEAVNIAHWRIATEPGFKEKVLEFMQENLGVDTAELVAQSLEPGGLDWKNVDPMIVLSAVRMMGLETSTMVQQLEGKIPGLPPKE